MREESCPKDQRKWPRKANGKLARFHQEPLRLARSEIVGIRSEEHTSELQSLRHLVCRLLLEKKIQSIYRALSGSMTFAKPFTSWVSSVSLSAAHTDPAANVNATNDSATTRLDESCLMPACCS